MHPLHAKKLFVLDMDGTIYLGDQLFEWTPPFLEQVRRRGAQALFLTNNSSRTSAQYVEKLQRLGLEAAPGDVFTSGDATLELLRHEGRWRRLFVLGTPPVLAEFERYGFELTDKDPEAVVLTFDTSLAYARLRIFCHLVRAGLPYVATHPDINCPTPDGPIPDVGAFFALIEASTGRAPDRIVGKPNADFLHAAMLRKGVTPAETMILGDRLYTDIECGRRAGVTTGLVLSGESTRAMADAAHPPPDYVFETLADLTALLG